MICDGLTFMVITCYIVSMLRIRRIRIRNLMAKAGIATQRDLAIALRWHESRVSGLFAGKVRPGPKTIERLCAVLACQPSDLIEYVEPPT